MLISNERKSELIEKIRKFKRSSLKYDMKVISGDFLSLEWFNVKPYDPTRFEQNSLGGVMQKLATGSNKSSIGRLNECISRSTRRLTLSGYHLVDRKHFDQPTRKIDPGQLRQFLGWFFVWLSEQKPCLVFYFL